jgi:hypothetical protein
MSLPSPQCSASDPGLGVELNMDTVLANPWDGDRLHLEMTPDPYDTHLHRHFAGG